MSHTPGKWIANLHLQMQQNGEYVHSRWIEVETPSGMRTVVSGIVGSSVEEGNANLYLIAAAPETKRQRDALLNTVKGMLDFPGIKTPADVDAFDRTVKEARALIAKCEVSEQ